MEVAKKGKGIEEEGGAVFDVTKFQLDYLTTPSGFLDIGIDFGKTDVATHTQQTDKLYIIAYPHFNVNGDSLTLCCYICWCLVIHCLMSGFKVSCPFEVSLPKSQLWALRLAHYRPLLARNIVSMSFHYGALLSKL